MQKHRSGPNGSDRCLLFAIDAVVSFFINICREGTAQVLEAEDRGGSNRLTGSIELSLFFLLFRSFGPFQLPHESVYKAEIWHFLEWPLECCSSQILNVAKGDFQSSFPDWNYDWNVEKTQCTERKIMR